MRQALTDACAWQGREMTENPRWQRDLMPAEIEEIDQALRAVERRDLAWQEVTAEAFPLPGMRDRFAEIAEELEEGSGMVKLRGLPVERYSPESLRRIWFGIGCHLGRPVFQNRRGELMREIRDEGSEAGQRYGQVAAGTGSDKPFLSSYARTLTNGPLRFHTDRTDVVGLLCVQQATSGGVSQLCSSVAVHNEMLRRRPDLLELLFLDIPRSRFGEEASSPEVTYDLPVFGLRDGKFTSHFSLTYIEAAELVAGGRKLSAAQHEALVPRIPYRERKHPAHVVEEIQAALEIEPQQGFAVPSAAHLDALRSQSAAELLVIVDLAVGDKRHSCRGVIERLVASNQVDDLEAPHGKRHSFLEKEAVGVGASVKERA